MAYDRWKNATHHRTPTSIFLTLYWARYLSQSCVSSRVRGDHGPPGAPPVWLGAYLNVPGIVVLAEASEPFSEVPSQVDPEVFGIEFIRELPEPKGIESEAGDDHFFCR